MATAGKKPLITYRDMPKELQAHYQYFTQADMTRLRSAGFKAAFTELEEGVRMYVQNYLAAKDHYV